MTLDIASTAFVTQSVISGAPGLHEGSVDDARLMYSGMAALSHEGPLMASMEEVAIPTADGETIRAHVLTPQTASQEPPKSVIVYYHGGGWVIGSIDDYITVGRHLAARTQSVVILAGYRLAPEHTYPTAPNDCWDALLWVDQNVEKLAGNRVPLVVAGDSAGGNLAAVVALRAKQKGTPDVSLQILVYPVTDGEMNTASFDDPSNQLLLSRDSMSWFWDHYVPDTEQRLESDASPSRAQDFAGVAPAVILTAEYDVLRDEGEAYADKLKAAGVHVVHKRFERQMHGFFTMHDVLPGALKALNYVGEQLDQHLAKRSSMDAVIVGAGFSGLYQLHRLREMGLLTRVLESGGGVGGTWYWNRYPGARCDIESMAYSFSFSPELEQEWQWSERYATQPEILRYAEHVAQRFDLKKDISFETRVERAVYDEDNEQWLVYTDTGEVIVTRYFIMATGCLSVPKTLDIPGKEKFQGPSYVTGRWPHEGVDFTGQRVAVIGTGSSAIQSIPLIAEQASALTVYQRTPAYSMPAKNRPLDSDDVAEMKSNYPNYRAQQRLAAAAIVDPPPAIESWHMVDENERKRRYDDAWDAGLLISMQSTFTDIQLDEEANQDISKYAHSRIRGVVKDSQTASALVPRSYPFATKRPCLDTNYYETYNRDNVELVDLLSTPITEITEAGITTSAGEKSFDAIVYATGFDAMTGALTAVDIRGRDNASLKDKWAQGPHTYLGLAIAGFPNLFTITGPSSPSVLSNMLVSIEQHVDWVSDCIAWMQERNLTTIEAESKAEDEWAKHTDLQAHLSLYPKANSWYMGANIPGKPKIFMAYVGGVGVYRGLCDSIAAADYEGFKFGNASS
ncbi:MAG: alpha/beta hydrolase fold domain-containing protein [Pseudomonadota bacterium]